MNVLYMTKSSPLANSGGAEKRAGEVTKRLAERGESVTVLTGKIEPGLPKSTTANGCEYRHVTCLPESLFVFDRFAFFATRYIFAIASFPVVCWLLFTREFDAVVENMTPYPTLTVVVAKLFGVPIVAVQHEFYDRSCYETYDPFSATIQLLVQNVLRLFTYAAVVVPSEHVKCKLVEYGIDEGRIVVVPNGIDAESFYDPNIESDPAMLVTIGRLSKRKGQDTVIEMFHRVVRECPQTQLHVVGAGPAREKLKAKVERLGIESSVTFEGFVSEDEKRRLLNSASQFVFASHQEGFGIVLLEAMAAGTPVVAVRLPVYESFFEDGVNGYLVSRNTEQFADQVIKLLTDEQQRKRIGERNVETAKQFTWDETTAGLESVLQSVSSIE